MSRGGPASPLRLTPMAESALFALTRGPLRWTAEVGWESSVGTDGRWNSHTIRWLAASRGYCVIKGTRAHITDAGHAEIMREWAA